MVIQNWSDKITVVELSEEPQFSEELGVLIEGLDKQPNHVVLNFSAIGFVNSSNVAKLLRLRKQTMNNHCRLIFTGVNQQVLGVFMVTGLDKIFEFANDMMTALASLQMNEPHGKSDKKK